ncbi:MAG: hypothetical protein AAFY66_01335 [Pseudomonadota bacterium]
MRPTISVVVHQGAIASSPMNDDITYVRLPSGFPYLAAIMDA